MTSRPKHRTFSSRLVIFLSALVILLGQSSPAFAKLTEEDLERFAQNEIEFYEPCVTGSGSGTTTAIGGYATISGNTATEKVWSGLRSLGLSEEVAAGIMGNMEAESHFNPAVYEWSFRNDWGNGLASASYDYENDPSDSRGIGLAGFSYSFRTTLWKYVKDRNSKLADEFFEHPEVYGIIGQGDSFIDKAKENGFTETEINTLYSYEITYLINEALANHIEGAKSNDYAKILSSTTVKDAAVNFADYYENCVGCSDPGGQVQTDRANNAQKWYEQFHGNNSFGSATAAQVSVSDGANVTLIGDSITENAKGYGVIDAKLPQADVHSQSSKHFEMHGGATNGGDSGLEILQQIVDANQLRSILVVELGTNDVDELDRYGNKVEDLIGLAKDAGLIVLVTAYEKNVNHSHNNELYKNAAEAHDNVVVADWAKIAEENKNTYFDSTENTHPNQTGTEALYDLIIDTINGSGAALAQSSSNSSEECCDPSNSLASNSGGTYSGTKYPMSDEDLKTLIRIAFDENGGEIPALKTELSQMANRTDKYGKEGQDVLDYVINSNWYGAAKGSCSGRTCSKSASVSDEQLQVAKDIIVNGNRSIPLEIVQHVTFGSAYSTIYNNGQQADADDRSQYQRGITEVQEGSSTGSARWIFWGWANPEKQSGDPFGYEPDTPPAQSVLQPTKGSSTTTAAGSDVTWTDDGWIGAGINKYYKDSLEDLPQQETWGAEFLTDSLSNNHSGKGPNKILLHVTEGGSSGGESVHDIYEGQKEANNGKVVPPHFTVDIKNRIVYQHQSIWKASAAIKSDEEGNGDLTAGIQIEIVGYDNGTEGDWDLTDDEKFSDADWQYLAEFLNAISVETGIPLESSVAWGDDGSVRMADLEEFKNYKGILSHKHAPLNDHGDVSEAVWKKIQNALSAFNSAQQDVCGPGLNSSGDVKALQETVLKFAWSEWRGSGYMEKKPDYEAAVLRSSYVGDTTCYPGCTGGIDCGAFVTILVRESGWDQNYNSANSNTSGGQLPYLKNPSNGWQDVTESIHSNQEARPGDVLITKEQYVGHTLIYVGDIPGFGSVMASASQCDRAPMADSSHDIMFYINGDGLHRKYYVFRKVKSNV